MVLVLRFLIKIDIIKVIFSKILLIIDKCLFLICKKVTKYYKNLFNIKTRKIINR